jgi:4-hydroxybenzoate polyprenyltransferase
VSSSAGSDRLSLVRRAAAYVELTHPGPLAFVMLATAGLSVVLAPDAPLSERAAILLAMLGAQIPIGVANELVDRETDALTKPGKPLPGGRASVRGGWLLLKAGVILLAAGSLQLPVIALVLVWAGCGVGVAYSLWFKRTLLAWLPYAVGLPLLPIWVAVALDQFRLELLSAYPIGFFAAIGVQLAQSAGDVRADREAAIRSVTTVAGEARTTWLCLAAVSISAVMVGVTGRGKPVVLAIAAFAVGVALVFTLVYRRHPEEVVAKLFPISATLVVMLTLAWVYAIGR